MGDRNRKLLAVSAIGLFGLLAAACGSDDSSDAGAGDTAPPADSATPTEAPGTTDAPATEPPTTDAPQPEWTSVDAPDDCMCADGSAYKYWVREADPEKVVFYMEGGGACFSAETCDYTAGNFDVTVDADDDPALRDGLFAFDNELNPLADYSFVFVPYCTGDVHIGNATTEYSPELTIHHRGSVNASTALADLAARFPGAKEIVVAGESAGSIPSPLYAGLAADLFPEAAITVLADGSGAYPDIPALNETIGGVWGTENAIPDWPVNEGLTAADWSLPGLFVQAGRHVPDRIVFARHDFAFDNTQVFFAELAGIPADDLVSLMDQNEAQIEAAGVDLLSFISPGDEHTILWSADLYTHEVEGVRLIDWVTDLFGGEPVTDVHCEVCTLDP